MPENDKIQLFEEQKIRTAWDEEKEEWYFSVVDVVGVLADSKAPLAYWRKLKQRLKAEGNETVTNCHAVNYSATSYRVVDYLKVKGGESCFYLDSTRKSK